MVMVDTFKCYNVITYLNIYFIQLQVFIFSSPCLYVVLDLLRLPLFTKYVNNDILVKLIIPSVQFFLQAKKA